MAQENILTTIQNGNTVKEVNVRIIDTTDPTAEINYITMDYAALSPEEKAVVDAYVALAESKIPA